MMGKRNRRASKRVSLAIAAAVLVGGGAAGAAVALNSHGVTDVSSAGYSQESGQWMSYSSAMSQAMNHWNKSWTSSIDTISHMQQVRDVEIYGFHHKTFVIDRGTVTAVGHDVFLVKSADGHYETFHVNFGTKTVNVGGFSTGISALTGGTTEIPSWWNMDTKVKGIATGDIVFVFAERVHDVNHAQLVLFAADTPTSTGTITNGANITNGVNTTTTNGANDTTTINGQTAVIGGHS